MPAPTLYIRLTRDVYALRQLPGDMNPAVLIALAKCARDACRDLRMCLHLSDGHWLYLYPNGECKWDSVPPRPPEIVEFRPACLAFLPGPGTGPVEEVVRPAAPPAPEPAPPPSATALAALPAALAPWAPPKPPGLFDRVNLVPWLILVGVAGRILMAAR